MATEPLVRRLWRENLILLPVAMLVTVPLLMPFTDGASGRAVRNGVCQSIGALLLVVLLGRVEPRGGNRRLMYRVRSGVNLPVAAFLVWAALGVLWAPDRAFAVGELMRLGSGALIYFTLALHLETRAQLRLLIDCLLGVILFLVGYGLLVQGSKTGGESGFRLASMFHSSLQLAAILAILLPLPISLAALREDGWRRMTAIAAALFCGAGLLLCLERGAWIAAGVGVLAWLFFAGRGGAGTPVRHSRRGSLLVAGGGLLAAVALVTVTGMKPTLTQRAGTIPAAIRGEDDSLSWRLNKWRGAAQMAAVKPFSGWGPGQFVLYQLPFTDAGLLPEVMHRYGASYDDMAFNEYLQTAAELGLPGLMLYLLILASFFSKAVRALERLPDGLRRATLMGCMAGIVAQMVDAMGNGAWRYTECTVFFWLLLGLGAAVIRTAYRSEPPAAPSTGHATAAHPHGAFR